MEEEIITPEEEIFDYHKLRYILDKDGYVCHASLGGLIICDLGECTEYNGDVPDGYETIVEWYDSEIETLNAWKIVDGNLVYDENKSNELQMLYEIQAEENQCASHKWVKDKLKVSSSVVTDELSSEANGTSLIVLDDAGNYEIPELKIESVSTENVKIVSSNKNILGLDFVTNTINGVEVKNNGDGTITLKGTSTDVIELNLNGSNTNQEMLYLIKDNISYAISGLTENVSLSLYSFDGTDKVYVGNYINQSITLSNSHKITQTVLSIPSGATFEEVIIKPQIEIGEATPFIKHEETKAIGLLEDNECVIDSLMSYEEKTIIMIDEEVTSSVRYYTKQYLSKKFAEIEVTEEKVMSTVSEMNETIEGQNTAISQISQTVNEIKSEINDIADITISADGYGNVSLDSINESEPIYIRIYPSNNEDISYIYPRDDLFPSDDLFLKGRTLRFETDDYYIDYELPNDLLYYDENNYDEFILDYDAQTCEVNKKVGYNADGSKYLLDTPQIISYEYPKIPLITGSYTVTMLGYNNAYMFIRMMCENIYTNQFATKVELNSAIIQTKDSITSQVAAQYATKGELVETETKINQTTNAINIEVKKKVNNEDYTSAKIIAKVNNDTSSVQIKASKIDLTGYLTVSSASSTYATNDGLKKGTTTIDGGCLTTGNIQSSNYVANKTGTKINLNDGTIDTKGFKVSSTGSITATSGKIGGWTINENSLSGSGTLSGGTISGSSIYGSVIVGGSINIDNLNGYYFNMGLETNHPNCSGLNVGWGGIHFSGGKGLNNTNGYDFDFSSGCLYAVEKVLSVTDTLLLQKSNGGYITIGSNIGLYGGYVYCGTKFEVGDIWINTSGYIGRTNTLNIGSASSIDLRGGSGGVYAGKDGTSQSLVKTDGGSYSSRIVKENIVKFTDEVYDNSLKLLNEIDLYKYDYKYNLYENKNQYGFIIDELEKNELTKEFFEFYDREAIVNGKELNFNMSHKKDDDITIKLKNYDTDVLDKYLLTCIKALLIKVNRLEEKLNGNVN